MPNYPNQQGYPQSSQPYPTSTAELDRARVQAAMDKADAQARANPRPVPAPAPVAAAPVDTISPQIQAFIDEMNKPFDANDPYVKQILDSVANRANTEARNRGIGGPMAVRGQAGLVAQASTGLDFQKQQAALQGMQALSNRDINQSELAFRKTQYETNRLDAANLNQYQNEQNEGQTWGTIAGVIAAGGLALATGGASLPFSAAIVQGGASIGRGLGGSSGAPAPVPVNYARYQPTYAAPTPGLGGGRGGGGGTYRSGY